MEYVRQLFDQLGAVPDVIWSAVIASILTLSGVLLSNASNTKRLSLQLKHDADQKEKERTSTMRREIYLQTMEQMVYSHSHLLKLTKVDIVKENIGDGFNGLMVCLAKVLLVAGQETSLLSTQFQTYFVDASAKLAPKLMPLHGAKTDIQINDDLYEQTLREVKRLRAAIDAQLESGRPDQAAIKQMQANYDFNFIQAQKYAAARQQAWDEYNKELLKFNKYVLPISKHLAHLQLPLIKSFKHELDVTIDFSDLERKLNEQLETMDATYTEIIAAMEVEVTKLNIRNET